MNHHSATAAFTGIMSGVAIASACLTVILALQNRALQNEISDTRRLWSDATASTADLRVQHALATADLASHRQRLADFQQEIATLESRLSTNAAVSSQPVPVRILDGTRLVGWGWIPASPTNRSSLAGEGVATVFLDRRGLPAASEPSPADTNPLPAASQVATVSSSAYSYHSYPYFLSGGWLVCGQDPDRDRRLDRQPPPPAAPSQEGQPLPTPVPPPAPVAMPARHQVQRTTSGRLPVVSIPVPRPTPFPQRPPTVPPMHPLTSVSTPANRPDLSPPHTSRMRLKTSDLSIRRPPTIR